ncbi:MAG TPA: alkaline ceramidase, partial [Firmicutes bacterium]|nr:alkaline ceramidase [Bacillota bacterium]
HPVVLGPDNFLVTADYPYYLLNALEQVYPGAQAMFMNGATGDVNVGHNTADSIQGKGNDRRTFREAARLGRILAGVALTASENAVAL